MNTRIAVAIVAGFFFATDTLLTYFHGPIGEAAIMRFKLLAWTATQHLQYLSK